MSSKRDHDCFTIGELSRLTGVNIETIRYYERMRLMPRPARTQSGRRSYGDDGLRTLAFIKRSRELGFPLADIRSLLSLRSAEKPCGDAQAIANRHLQDMRSKLRHLEELEKILADAVGRCPGENVADCTILEVLAREPEQAA